MDKNTSAEPLLLPQEPSQPEGNGAVEKTSLSPDTTAPATPSTEGLPVLDMQDWVAVYPDGDPSIPKEKESHPQSGGPAAEVPPAPPNGEGQPPKRKRRWRRLGWLCLLAIVLLFLGGIPVEKIPLLRNVVYAMGFSKQDAARMSFLRALLTWTDETIGIPGNWKLPPLSGPLEAETSEQDGVFGKNSAGRLQDASMGRYIGQSQLIDFHALHALQRKQGQELDAISGTIVAVPGQETQADPATLRDSEVNVQTEANRAQGDVYFGSEAYSVNRQNQDGYDSVKALTKIKNPYISDGQPIDWLVNTAHRMMNISPGLSGINRELSSSKVNWQANLADEGAHKPNRDLYHAWLTSRMTKYTSNIMLKKSLADTSFLGADIPTMATSILSFSGVQIDTDAFREDQEAWKEYLEFEKNCKKALNSSGSQIQDQIDKFNWSVTHPVADGGGKRWDFPTNCVEAYPAPSYESSQFAKRVQEVQANCVAISEEYKNLENICHMQVFRSAANCRANTQYQQYWNTFTNTCALQFEAKFQTWWNEVWWKANKANYQTLIDAIGEEAAKQQIKELTQPSLRNVYQQGQWRTTDGKQYTEKQFIDATIAFQNPGENYPSNGQVTMLDVFIDQNGGGSDYFPKEENVAQTIKEQFGENRLL